MLLAETVSFTEGEILVIILVLLGMLAVVVATVGLGFFWAWRAGRGSQLALAGWICIASLEAVAVLGSVASLFSSGPNPVVAGPLGALVGQGALYFVTRGKARDGRWT